MKLLLIVGIIAITSTPLVLAAGVNKVKIISAKVSQINDEYVNKNTFKLSIVNVNGTYSRLVAYYELRKDFPKNIDYLVTILRSDSKDSGFKKIHSYDIKEICGSTKDEYFEYLPAFLLDLNKSGKCYPKGVYNQPDASYFRFYDVLTQQELTERNYIQMIQLVKTGQTVLYSLEFIFQIY